VSSLSLTLAAVRRDVERAEASSAWRLGHRVTRMTYTLRGRPIRTQGALTAVLRRIEELERATRALPAPEGKRPAAALPAAPAPAPAPARPDDEIARQQVALAAEIRERLGDPPPLDAWPAVSIVVLNRNGRKHLERLVAGLREWTDYPQAELVVVDNGSTDGSADWVRTCDPGMPVRLVENEDNPSFAEANAQGAAAASGDLLLFLNNDVEPFEPGWLTELVAAHVRGGHALTGAVLLHGARTSPRAADGRVAQHRGIRLRRGPDGVLPYNDGNGADVFDEPFGADLPAPAVSAACLLAGRETLESLGGFSPRFRYGLEDVDLGMRAGAAGLTVAVSGRTFLYHHESATRTAEGSDFTRATRESNRRAWLERWGPAARRAYRLGRLGGDGVWTDGSGPHLAITVTSLDAADGWGDWHTAQELGAALERRGWRVTPIARAGEDWQPLPGDVDYVLTLLDRYDVRGVPTDVPVIAWIRNWTDRWLERPWLDRVDVLLGSSTTTCDLVERRTGRRPVLFPLATNPERFAPARPAERTVDCVFTGNHWGEDRAIQGGLAPGEGQTLAIHGRNWEGIGHLAPFSAGPAPYDELPAIYASARLVLDDTQEPTLRYDAVNARVFDALAAGTLVLTNCAAGVRELFDDEFPVWDSAETLRAQRDALLADDERRERLAARYRETVLARHTYERRADALVELLREHEARPSVCIKIGAPDWEQAERWGDLHFARALERGLRRRGHRTLVQVLGEWEQLEGLAYDVVLHLKGLSRHFTKSGQLNVLWCISHPDELTAEECDGYDLVCVASAAFAETLRERTSTPVIVLDQATDPALFFPDPEPDPSAHRELVYVANSRNVLRPMMRDLLPTERDLAVYGANWEGLIDARHVVAEHVPNTLLRRVYSSAAIVLADHWDDMRRHGFVSNRIYDALACGACIISDDVAGLAERFPGAVAIYRTREELDALIDRLLADPEERAAMGERGRVLVAEGGDFASRVDALLAALPQAAGREAPAPGLRG
jgi:GT2 family glycosyltransferase/spore maturation protein CgeB